eukprot:361014-Chlamydomonas_euryale.AAC.1
MFPGVDTTKPALDESRAKAPMVIALMRAAGVQADIAAATHGGVWLAPPPLATAPPAPAPVPTTALPIVSPLLGGVSPDQVALTTALAKAKAAADLKLPVSNPRVMVMALTHLIGP